MIEELNIRYLTDNLGNRTDVQISYESWLEIERELIKLAEYQSLKNGLVEAFEEVKELKEDKEKRISLKEFLNEC